MNELIEKYVQIRSYLQSYISKMIEIYFMDVWNPFMKFTVMKETNNLLKKELESQFPDFPKQLLPKVKFRIFEDEKEVEATTQNYINEDPNLIFLGAGELDRTKFDFYIGKSFGSSEEYTFYARYGHSVDCVYSGCKVAAAEYFQGIITPLSVAFGMAVEDGFIA